MALLLNQQTEQAKKKLDAFETAEPVLLASKEFVLAWLAKQEKSASVKEHFTKASELRLASAPGDEELMWLQNFVEQAVSADLAK